MRSLARERGLGLLAVLIALTWLPTAESAESLSSGLTLTDMTLAPHQWAHGMIERRFAIENPTSRTVPVQITLPASTYSGTGLAALSQTVLANAKTRTLVIMPQPPTPVHGYSAAITTKVGNHRSQRTDCQPVNFNRYRYNSSALSINLLVSKGLSAEDLKARLISISPEDNSSSSGYRPGELKNLTLDQLTLRFFEQTSIEQIKPFRFEGDGAAWPRHWLAYSAFDGCLIAATDYEQMPEEARHALRDYAAIGGQVTFMGLTKLPADWSTPASLSPARPIDQPPGAAAAIGFGRIAAIDAATCSALTSNALMVLAANWIETARPWLNPHDAISDNLKAIPVAGNVRVPARSFLVILLAFVLLAGPGAVIFTRRANRRIWLLVLVPSFSLLFSLSIVIYALLSEGITPTLRRQAVTLLDQTRQHAATFAAIGVYAPISLRDGLHFDLGTEITPLTGARYGKIRVGHSQHYVSGWTQPRMPAFFRLRRSETRVERLVITRQASDTVEVINALGAPILRLKLCDHQGNLYDTRQLASGEKRTLTSTRKRPSGAPPMANEIGLHDQRSIDAGWNISALVENLLTEEQAFEPATGSYIAVLDGSPFQENPLAYCRTKASARSVVAGWYGVE